MIIRQFEDLLWILVCSLHHCTNIGHVHNYFLFQTALIAFLISSEIFNKILYGCYIGHCPLYLVYFIYIYIMFWKLGLFLSSCVTGEGSCLFAHIRSMYSGSPVTSDGGLMFLTDPIEYIFLPFISDARNKSSFWNLVYICNYLNTVMNLRFP
jgi:hypothetical protein